MAGATGDEAAVGRCDLVIEAIVENAAAKQELFAPPGRPTRRPDPLHVEHLDDSHRAALGGVGESGAFWRPALLPSGPQPPPGRNHSRPANLPGTIAALVDHVRAIDRLPLVVEDGPGFVVNRILQAYLSEAMDLLMEGATIESIEQTMLDFGMPIGPLEALDQIGLDVALGCGWVLAAALGERVVGSPILTGMIRSGRLGCKSGEGFFRYGKGPAAGKSVSPLLPKLIAQWARPPRRHDAQSIAARLLSAMVLEAARILHEGKVRDPRHRSGHGLWAGLPGVSRRIALLGRRIGRRRVVGDARFRGGRRAASCPAGLAHRGDRFPSAILRGVGPLKGARVARSPSSCRGDGHALPLTSRSRPLD